VLLKGIWAVVQFLPKSEGASVKVVDLVEAGMGAGRSGTWPSIDCSRSHMQRAVQYDGLGLVFGKNRGPEVLLLLLGVKPLSGPRLVPMSQWMRLWSASIAGSWAHRGWGHSCCHWKLQCSSSRGGRRINSTSRKGCQQGVTGVECRWLWDGARRLHLTSSLHFIT
jgi:hypothetical protein